MSDPADLIDLRAWVSAARTDRALHRQRQVTHILLWAVANTPELSKHLYLKGGALMALAFASPRQTADVDFTVPDDGALAALSARLRSTPAAAVDRAPALLGYPDLDCRIQRWRHRPRDTLFADADASAIEAKLGSARRGTGEMDRLDRGQAVAAPANRTRPNSYGVEGRTDSQIRRSLEPCQILAISTEAPTMR